MFPSLGYLLAVFWLLGLAGYCWGVRLRLLFEDWA
jgi:hypothetical protein